MTNPEQTGKLTEIFRPEALDHRFRAAIRAGEPLKLSSAPMRWTFWLLISSVAGALAFAAVATLGEFVTGPAMVQVDRTGSGPGDAGACSVTAYLPARHLPALRRGLDARVLLDGLDAEHRITLEEVEPRIIPAHEARRLLGGLSSEPSGEPVVPVTRRLDSCTFRLGEHEVPLVDGMRATVEVRIGSRSILSSLVPGLRGTAGLGP